MENVKKLAENFAHDMIDGGKIDVEHWGAICEAVIYGYTMALSNISSIQNSDGVFLMPDSSLILKRKS